MFTDFQAPAEQKRNEHNEQPVAAYFSIDAATTDMLVVFECVTTTALFEQLKLPHTYEQVLQAALDTSPEGQMVGLIGGLWKDVMGGRGTGSYTPRGNHQSVRLISGLMLDEEKRRPRCFDTMGLWRKILRTLVEQGQTRYLLVFLPRLRALVTCNDGDDEKNEYIASWHSTIHGSLECLQACHHHPLSSSTISRAPQAPQEEVRVVREIGIFDTCWWYSLCNFQYRQYYENTCPDHLDC